MRDPAGQLPNRLHLLRLDELKLEVLLLGGIDEVNDDPATASPYPGRLPILRPTGVMKIAQVVSLFWRRRTSIGTSPPPVPFIERQCRARPD